MRTTRIKICCIASIEEARLAIDAGAAAVGLVSEMPSGPGVIDEETIANIAASVPPTIATFLLTSRTDAPAIIDQQRRCGVNTIQIVDHVDGSVHERLRVALPGVSLVQVVHVSDARSIDEAVEVSPRVDAILLDSGNPKLTIKELGGTGRVHDWSLSAKIVEAVPVPVYLAGGLRPGNVAEAIERVRPYGVDLCSGVRTDGLLDQAKLTRFMTSARSPGS